MKLLLYILLLTSSLVFSQPVINSVSVSATQALITFTAPTSPACTLQVSEFVGLSPLVADTDPAVFTSANTEAAHLASSTVSGGNTIRVLRIGLRKAAIALDTFSHSRALSANTPHYAAITCNGLTSNTTFTTGVPGGIVPEPLPTDAAQFGQLAFPQFTDFTKPVIEPRTGMKIYSADPNAWSASQAVTIPANNFSGGTGWTNLSNVLSYGTASATTNNTNPLTIYARMNDLGTGFADQVPAIGGYWPYDTFNDLGLDVYGSATNITGNNADVRVCLSLDSQTCFTAYQTITLPSGSDASTGCTPSNINVGVSATACTLPATYPSAYFAGWGKPLPRGAWPHVGRGTLVNTILTATQTYDGGFINLGSRIVDVNAYFDQDWPAGTKIFINGSSPTCTNNFCTIASVQSGTQLTISEAFVGTLNPTDYEAAGLSLIVNKVTATGSVNLSFRLHAAKGYPQNLGFLGGCATSTVTASDGLVGYPCIFPTLDVVPRLGPGALYLIGVSGTGSPAIRVVSLFRNNGCTNAAYGTGPCPSGSTIDLGPTGPLFDSADPSKMYIKVGTADGHSGLFLAHYTGTWLPYNHPYAGTTLSPMFGSEITWTNLTPFTSCPGGLDIGCQITTNAPGYNATLYGDPGNAKMAGLSGPYIIFESDVGGQDSPCWIHAFTTAGLWYKSWYSADSTTAGVNISNGLLRYSGCHAVSPTDGSTVANGPSFVIGNSNLVGNNSDVSGGPFTGTITAVSKMGSFNANTSLPWPIDPAAYDAACPGGLPAWVTAHGAIGNQCVQVQGTLPCNAFAGATESSNIPTQCPYNSSWGYLGGLKVGDMMKDCFQPGSCGSVGDGFSDNEGFMVVTTPTLVSGNTYQWTMQRNANFSYCAFGVPTDTPPKDGVDNTAQMQHANTWSYYMAGRDGCRGGKVTLVDIVGNNGYVFNMNVARGHYDLTEFGPQTLTMIGSGALVAGALSYTIESLRTWNLISQPFDFSISQDPTFAGFLGPTGMTQSYIDAKQFNATTQQKQYAFDFKHYDPYHGAEPEYPGQVLGTVTDVALQAGTTSVYRITPTGPVDIKHQAINTWVGKRYLIDISSAATGNQITDAKPWTSCYAYNASECRAGAIQGDFFAVMPVIDKPLSEFISSSTNATPIVITTSTPHGIREICDNTRCDTVSISHHLVNTNANGTYSNTPGGVPYTIPSPTTISLTTKTGNGIGGATGTASIGQCWESQINLNTPCASAGPITAMQAIQLYTAGPVTYPNIRQRSLSSLLMGPEQQYVYSRTLPTPDASYLLFTGFLVGGYHTGIMMAKLPPFPTDTPAAATYTPLVVTGVGNNVYVEFGYDEYGSDGVNKFYCTTRAENCRVAGASVVEATPFSFASEALTNANGYSITVPALPGMLLYYRSVVNGVTGPTQVSLSGFSFSSSATGSNVNGIFGPGVILR